MAMKAETKVGLFVVVGLFILLIGILWKSNLVLRAGGYNVVGQFKTVSGLLAGGEVRYRGYVVGTVSSVLPGPSKVEVHMYIQDGINIPEGSRFRIDFDGLIGEKFVNVIPNTEGRRNIVSGEVLQGTAAQGLVDFIDAGTDNLLETKQILAVLRKIITSEDSQQSLQSMIVNISSIAKRTDSLLLSMDEILRDPSIKNAGRNINAVLVGLNQTIVNLNHLTKSLDKNVEGKDVKAVVTNMKELTQRLNALTESFGKDKDRLMKDVAPILAETREMIGQSRGLVTRFQENTRFLDSTTINIGANIFQNSTYEVGGRVNMGQTQFELSGGSPSSGAPMKTKNILVGGKVAGEMKAHVGVVNYEPGVRVDIPLNEKTTLEASVYNPSNLSYMLKTQVQLIPNIKALLGLEQTSGSGIWTFGLGMDSAR